MGSSPTPGTRVISASRRTDLPRWYLPWLAGALRAGEATIALPYGGQRTVSLRPEHVHTLVLWSKDFSLLLAERGVRKLLARYDQITAQFTVTGLGGGPLEPGVPPPEEALEQLPRLVNLCGSPHRVTVRFDPIVHWWAKGRIASNIPWAESVFRACARHGIRDLRTSFATLYGKVQRRPVRWYDPSAAERGRIAADLRDLARLYRLDIAACSDPSLEAAGIPRKGCIDGRGLSSLHPRGTAASLRRDRGQRRDCLCTESVDIGSYTMRCPGGCLYCYAQPALSRTNGRAHRPMRTRPPGPTAERRPSAPPNPGSGSGTARTPLPPRDGDGTGSS
ncbi:DUF1848 family protein [Candidatus Bipolaricaulota bacterium]|nr:DUF1848 family protein [Candidatus Bipolaricaulota bacterium]